MWKGGAQDALTIVTTSFGKTDSFGQALKICKVDFAYNDIQISMSIASGLDSRPIFSVKIPA